ncbi:MAG: YifB family Mg chelatase-like AAA ATPase [Gammaproteobacteria bacterium]
MSYAIAHGRCIHGGDALAVSVEVHIANGLPGFTLVGLPETALRESRERVRSAIVNSGFEFPQRRITVNLAPGDVPKDGTRLDLAIALGILAASGQVPAAALAGIELSAELALDGTLRPVHATLAAAIAAAAADRELLVSPDDAPVAALVSAAVVRAAASLGAVAAHLADSAPLPRAIAAAPVPATPRADLCDIVGQLGARRALEVAAAGGHNLLLVGPPGTGKSMLAERLPGILPPLREEEALASAALHAIAGHPVDAGRWRERAFRAPHHSASAIALVGGGRLPRPGEISLAHHGVLFLDELPEFDRRSLEVLREPLESGRVTIARAARSVTFPAEFQLVAAMNPCPCGYDGDPRHECRCTPDRIARYRARVSGPLAERIDIHLTVARQALDAVHRTCAPGEPSAAVRARVIAARALQATRQGGTNARLDGAALRTHAALDDAGRALLARAAERLALSARSYHKVLRLARTIADLDGGGPITTAHLGEAIGYRALDRASAAR